MDMTTTRPLRPPYPTAASTTTQNAVESSLRIWLEDSVAEVVISLGSHRFGARFETAAAPLTCAAFRRILPFSSQVIHVRWSGEAVWAPLGDLSIGVGVENATTFPIPARCSGIRAA
jgi:hypothetical protein